MPRVVHKVHLPADQPIDGLGSSNMANEKWTYLAPVLISDKERSLIIKDASRLGKGNILSAYTLLGRTGTAGLLMVESY